MKCVGSIIVTISIISMFARILDIGTQVPFYISGGFLAAGLYWLSFNK